MAPSTVNVWAVVPFVIAHNNKDRHGGSLQQTSDVLVFIEAAPVSVTSASNVPQMHNKLGVVRKVRELLGELPDLGVAVRDVRDSVKDCVWALVGVLGRRENSRLPDGSLVCNRGERRRGFRRRRRGL